MRHVRFNFGLGLGLYLLLTPTETWAQSIVCELESQPCPKGCGPVGNTDCISERSYKIIIGRINSGQSVFPSAQSREINSILKKNDITIKKDFMGRTKITPEIKSLF